MTAELPPADPSPAAAAPVAPAASDAPAGAAATAAATAPTSSPRWFVPTAVVLGLLAVAALVSAWRTDQRVAAVEQELVRRQQASADQANEARLLAKQAAEGVRDAAAKVALLEARVAEVAIQRTQLEDLIQSLSRSRDENMLVDIEAAVRMAQQQAAITGSAEPVVQVLRQSDERLARYNQPRLEGVRRAIARDLERVKSTGVTDITALTIRLDEVVRIVDELPMLAAAEMRRDGDAARAPAPAAPASAVAPAAGGMLPAAWREAWDGISQRVVDELRSLLRVTRIDRPDAVLLAPDHAFFVRENLKLRLLNARLGLMSRQFGSAQSDLMGAQSALERYFDRGSKRTGAAIDAVRQIAAQSRQINLPRPDDTLAALTAATAGR